MANTTKAEAIFEELLKKYDSAARGREQANAVRGNEYNRELENIKQDVRGFRKRFTEALAETV